MANFLKFFIPQEEKFFDLLAEQSANALKGAEELKDFVANYSKLNKEDRKARAKVMKALEDKGDEITHSIIDKLNKTFITPIDKEDIHEMAILLDDIIDLIEAVALRFSLLGIEKIDVHITKLVDIILKAVIEINSSVTGLRKLKDMHEHYVRIQTLENEADDVYHNALDELFHFYKDAIDIIKYKEIYELLEKVTDKCEDITHIMESIVVKHA